jgi:hypothetical protein
VFFVDKSLSYSRGGQVAAIRAGNAKKKGWQKTLGLKDAILWGLIVAVLMVSSFVMGLLAGRGEIFRLAYTMGLLKPEPAKVAAVLPILEPPNAATPPLAGPVAAVGQSAASAAPVAKTAKATPAPAPVAGNMLAAPAAPAEGAAPAKKGKAAAAAKKKPAQDDHLNKIRRDVAPKLAFQNSFDAASRVPRTGDKAKADKAKAAKPAPAPVKVGQFRDAKAARTKVAQLQKQGVKATLKQTKDGQGALYTVYKPGKTAPASASAAPDKKTAPAAPTPTDKKPVAAQAVPAPQ